MAIAASIRLHELGRSIDASQVYFAFEDGRFDYDCHTCGAQCCRGHNYSLADEQETLHQLTRRPALGVFTESRSAPRGGRLVRNLKPTCFFLDQAGQCDIQREAGYAAKPETCRLFPFNGIRVVGRHLFITPHAELCPLDVVPRTRVAPTSSHEQLLAELVARGIHAASVVVRPDEQADALAVLERQCLEATTRLAGQPYHLLLDAQAEATGQHAGGRSPAPNVGHLTSLMAQALGIAEDPGTFSADDEFVLAACTPFLRAQLMLGNVEFAALSVDAAASRVIRVLAALRYLAGLAAMAGMRRITFQSLAGLLAGNTDLLLLLAKLDLPVYWNPQVPLVLDANPGRALTPNYFRLLKRLVATTPATALSLHSLLLTSLPDEPLQRVDFLRFLARTLRGALCVESGEARPRVAAGGFAALRRRAQRTMVRTFDADTLAAVLARRRQSPPRAAVG